MLLLGIWMVFNIFQGIFTELADIEAYYWSVASELSWGYFEHPPMSAFFVWLGTNLFGDSELAIRIFTILLQPICLFLFWQLIKTERSTWRDAYLYFLIAFSIPQLQLSGWLATPEAMMMLAMAFLLWSFNRYLKIGDILSVALMGLGFAFMAYAKYQGIIIVLLLLAANWRRLKDWKLLTAIGIGLLLILPHLYWQYSHDWISFKYQIFEQGNGIVWSDTLILSFVLFGIYVLALIIPFILYLIKNRSKDPMDKTMRYLIYGFLSLCLLAALFGHVYPLWITPISLPVLYLMYQACQQYQGVKKYVWKFGTLAAILFIVLKVFIMSYSGSSIEAEIFNNKIVYGGLADEMNGRTLIFDNQSLQASKMKYYTNGDAIAYPSIYKGGNHYQLIDQLDEHLYGKPVAVVITDHVRNSYNTTQLKERFGHYSLHGTDIYYDTISYYIPTKNVSINYSGLPINTLTERPIILNLDIYNPYDYNIPISDFRLVGHFTLFHSEMHDVEIPLRGVEVLPSKEHTKVKAEFYVPKMSSGRYKFGLSLQRPPATSWYNSPLTSIQITNPSQRRF